jgi:DNA-binding MarR family transcriptional regulator
VATQLKTRTPALDAWVRLLRGHAAVTRALNAQLVREHGLTINDYEALLLLANADDESLRRTDLARNLELTASGVTRLLDGLEASGLVEKGVCAADARVVYAVLTEAGRAKLEQASSFHVAAIDEVFSEFSADEIEALGELLGRLPGASRHGTRVRAERALEVLGSQDEPNGAAARPAGRHVAGEQRSVIGRDHAQVNVRLAPLVRDRPRPLEAEAARSVGDDGRARRARVAAVAVRLPQVHLGAADRAAVERRENDAGEDVTRPDLRAQRWGSATERAERVLGRGRTPDCRRASAGGRKQTRNGDGDGDERERALHRATSSRSSPVRTRDPLAGRRHA